MSSSFSTAQSQPWSFVDESEFLPGIADDTMRRMMQNDPTLNEVSIFFQEGLSYYPFFCAVDCVATNRHLTSLRLSLSPPLQDVSWDGLKKKLLLRLALRLPDSHRLETLHVDALNYFDHFLPMYMMAFALPLTSMVNLSLVRCGIGSNEAAALAVALPRTPTLQSLNLSGNRLDNVKVILESLLLLGGLADLNLDGNPLAADAIDHVSRALSFNSTLKVLRIHSSIPSNFRVTEAQAMRFGLAIAANHTLKQLFTNFCDGAKPFHVARGLAENFTLETLSWTFSSADELFTSRVLSKRSVIRELALPNSCEILLVVARGLRKNTSMQKLTLLEPEPRQELESARKVSKSVTRFVDAVKSNTSLLQLEWSRGVVLALEPKEFKERYELCGIVVRAIENNLISASFYVSLNRCGRGLCKKKTLAKNTHSNKTASVTLWLLPHILARVSDDPKRMHVLLTDAVPHIMTATMPDI